MPLVSAIESELVSRDSEVAIAAPSVTSADVSVTSQMLELQEALVEIQQSCLEAQQLALDEPSRSTRQLAFSLQQSTARLLKVTLKLQQSELLRPSLMVPQEEGTAAYHAGLEMLAQQRLTEAVEHLTKAVELTPHLFLAHKALGDAYLGMHRLSDAVQCYEKALYFVPEFPEADNNLAIALLGRSEYEKARSVLHRMLTRARGLPEHKRHQFEPGFYENGRPQLPAAASPAKLADQIEQLCYLIDNRRLDESFRELVERYRAVWRELLDSRDRVPYSVLSQSQLEKLCGYYDRVIFYSETHAIEGPALNPALDYDALQEQYIQTNSLYFDDLLTEPALAELRRFLLESTVFFKHSEAGFVGTYVNDGFNCNLIFQILRELRENFSRILKDKHLNNMWCYRYGSTGPGVRPHNGDGSVTINFYLTPDEANLDPNGGGMVMYDKDHPKEWDWLKFNTYKDDPEIQSQITAYLEGSRAVKIPYRCNRAVLFRSTLFHSTDPFHFRDGYENRRMNVTMLFGQRGEESLPLK